MAVDKHQKKIVSKLLPNQLGVGNPGATEFIYKGVDRLNRLNRFQMRREVRRMSPEICPWVEYTYSVRAQLIVDHNNNVL